MPKSKNKRKNGTIHTKKRQRKSIGSKIKEGSVTPRESFANYMDRTAAIKRMEGLLANARERD